MRGLRRTAVGLLALAAARAALRPRSGSTTPASAADVRASDGTRLHVEIDGRPDAPITVVLVHGYGASMAEWRHQREALAGRARLVLFDQRGHGRSGWAHPRSATIDQLGEDLRAVLRAHAQGTPTVLVAHSLGGMAVLALVRSHPGIVGASVHGVALVSTSAGHLLETGVPARMARLVRRTRVATVLLWCLWVIAPAIDRLSPLATDAGRDFLSRRLFAPDEPAGDDLEQVQRDVRATPASVLFAFAPSMLHHHRADAVGVLSAVPVLVLSGTHDSTIPAAHSQRLFRALDGVGTLTLIPGAGHMVNVTRADEVSAALSRLLNEVEHLCASGRRT